MRSMHFRPVRRFLGLTLASILAMLPMVAWHFLDTPSRAIAIAAFGLFTSWIMWFAAMSVLIAIGRRRGRAYRTAYYILGALLAYLFPLAELVVVMSAFPVFLPNLQPPAPLAEIPIQPALVMGIYHIPFGLLGAWLFLRIAARPSTADLEQSAPAPYRRWQDVRKWQMIAGLMLAAAMLGIILIFVSALLGGTDSNPAFTISGFSGVMAGLEIWFLAPGLLYLFVIGRRRGNLRRRDCLLLGTLLTCLFPVFAIAAGIMLGFPMDGSEGNAFGAVRMFIGAVAFSIMLIPLGLLSGWLFWRVGVQPAQPSDLKTAPVFD